MTGRDLLLGNMLQLIAEGEGSRPVLAAWSRVAWRGFHGEQADDTGRTHVPGGERGSRALWLNGVIGQDRSVERLQYFGQRRRVARRIAPGAHVALTVTAAIEAAARPCRPSALP